VDIAILEVVAGRDAGSASQAVSLMPSAHYSLNLAMRVLAVESGETTARTKGWCLAPNIGSAGRESTDHWIRLGLLDFPIAVSFMAVRS